ncbi:hypothetical protein [Leptospira interrogans]|uniref:Uncharacterized protein n=4 Tax=Leptospira interrogans TaxID=173 RepID=M6S178_LEPIR|nr:hypothetical protein [Leptospira interrogans]EKN89494.1 hypothetical protein LEP1GSC027_0543 [Leptospira interrogans str. 2002000624]EKP23344.1 hypothetical protein LEP1GSC117_2269 [Leptospira interrogans serovar Icterohaemorrhagiae str. Verdun LP]EKP74535.1 hypothetical protein LEP1GSC173_1936 [Leptospira interrogans str. HAI1594]EKQ36975.1 hypothetical protein LEP1GSC025_1807 [Leptospira interrogans str. 2002000621]EKQ45511.1 hypothetical protein LEP1GSC026_2248 [Leptospira interrogans st
MKDWFCENIEGFLQIISISEFMVFLRESYIVDGTPPQMKGEFIFRFSLKFT